MLAMVFNCLLLVPISQAILNIHVVKKMRDCLLPIYIIYIYIYSLSLSLYIYIYIYIYIIGQRPNCKFSVICTNGSNVLIFTVFHDTGICTSVSLLYNDGYQTYCLDHAGMYRVLCEVQMIYNLRFTILYICIYI